MSRRPLPREVYWRRRFLVLAVLILLAWLVIRFWPSGGADPSEPTSAPAPTATAATPTPSASSAAPMPSASASAATRASSATVTLASATTPCDPETLRVTPSVPPGQVVGEEVTVNLLVSSTAGKACTFRAKQADLLVVISAGKTPVWDSTVCRTALVDEPVVVSPRWASMAVGTWSGRGSGGGCSAKEGWASPGTYTIQVGTLGGEPGRARFELEREKPRPEKEAEAEKETDADAEERQKKDAKPSPKASATPAD